MAKLLAVLESLDTLPEPIREYYVEKDGKFYLEAEGVEDVTGLKSALAKERKARQDAEAKIKELRDVIPGIEDPKKVAETLLKIEELQQFDPTKEAEKIAEQKYNAREKQLLERHRAEVETERSKAGNLFGQLKRVMVDAVATKAIADQKGAVELLLPHIQNQARLRQDGEKFIVEILDGTGAPRIGDSNGSLMTIEQFVSEMKASPVFGRAFDGAGSSGSGGPAGPSRQTVSGAKLITRETLQQGGTKLEDLATGKVKVAG
jgi:hypothetical protein